MGKLPTGVNVVIGCHVHCAAGRGGVEEQRSREREDVVERSV